MRSGTVRIIAPVGFLEAAISENSDGRQRDGPPRHVHVRQPAPRRSEGPGRRGSGDDDAGGTDHPDPANGSRHRDRTEDGDRWARVRVHARPRQRSAGRDALVHRGLQGRDRRRELLPHAAQHVHAPRGEDQGSARVVEVPRADDRALGRSRRGHVRDASLAGVGTRPCARHARKGPRRVPVHPRRDAPPCEPRLHGGGDRRASQVAPRSSTDTGRCAATTGR